MNEVWSRYRGKCLKDGKWAFGDLLHMQTDGKVHTYIADSEGGGLGLYEVDPATVGQKLEVWDGRTIYGGDAVTATYDIGDGCDPRGLRHKLYILDSWPAIIEFAFDLGHGEYLDVNVVGNIHEGYLDEIRKKV